MAIINPPSWLQAGTYNARADRLGIGSAISVGGVTAPTSYAVTQTVTPSMSIQVSAGSAYVPNTFGLTHGFYAVVNDGSVTIALDASHPNFNRTDLIVLTVKDSQYAGSDNFAVIQKITGAPAPGANPAPNPVPDNSIVLASVLVTASTSSVTTGNISLTLRQIARLQPSMVNAVQTVTPASYPTAPANGQFVVDEALDQLRVFVNNKWVTVSPSTVTTVASVGARPPGAVVGTLVYEQPSKRFYSFDGTKWNYAGGGGGDVITKTFTSWSANYRSLRGVVVGGQQPLTLWRNADGRMCIEGSFTNANYFTGASYQGVYGVCALPAGYAPPVDVRGLSFLIVPNVANYVIHILIKGTTSQSTTPGSPGTLLWQAQNTFNILTAPETAQFKVPFMSWETL